MLDEEGNPICEIRGRCEAMQGARGTTNCIHCGKELHERDDKWWTWDAEFVPNPKPQDDVS